jgi:hypothetical protein
VPIVCVKFLPLHSERGPAQRSEPSILHGYGRMHTDLGLLTCSLNSRRMCGASLRSSRPRVSSVYCRRILYIAYIIYIYTYMMHQQSSVYCRRGERGGERAAERKRGGKVHTPCPHGRRPPCTRAAAGPPPHGRAGPPGAGASPRPGTEGAVGEPVRRAKGVMINAKCPHIYIYIYIYI